MPEKPTSPRRLIQACLLLGFAANHAAAQATAREDLEKSAPPQVSIETLSGAERVDVAGLRLDTSGAAPVLHLGAERRVPLDEVIFLRFNERAAVPRGKIAFLFRGGDRLHGTITGGADEKLEIAADALPAPLTVRLTDLTGLLVLDAFAGEVERERFVKTARKGAPTTDELHVQSGEKITGILDSIGPERVRFSSDRLGDVERSLAKIRAIRLAQIETGGEPPAASVLGAAVTLTDGGLLSGQLLAIGASGVRLRHAVLDDVDIVAAAVREVSIRGGRCRYLSDMAPAHTDEHLGALFVTTRPFQRDANVEGAPLRMQRRVYAKGLGVHAYSLLEYDLGGEFERFQATAGLDDSARPPPEAPETAGGSVVFRVLLDGKQLLEAPLSYKDPPREIDLPVKGGSRLRLEVEFGNFLLGRDRANWANARVIR